MGATGEIIKNTLRELRSNNREIVFDPQVITKYFLEGSEEEEALRIFTRCSHKMLECIDTRLSQLVEAHKQLDRPSLRFYAHLIKGSSAAMGAPRIAHLCEEIENSIGTQEEALLKLRIDQLKKLTEQFKGELGGFVEKMESEN